MSRVLIVDNKPKITDYLKDLLEGRGFECGVCNSGATTLKELGDTVINEKVPLYNLFIMDLGGLDDMRGSGLVARIRGKGGYNDEEIIKREAYTYFYPSFHNMAKAEEVYRLIHENYSSTPIIGMSKRPEGKTIRKYKVYHVIKVDEETNTVDENFLFSAIKELLG